VPLVVTAHIFTSVNPYDSSAWSQLLNVAVDRSLFWKDDGQVYLQYAGIHQQSIDPETGKLGKATLIWDGCSYHVPEGPYMHKKDGPHDR
jgi:beta-xylosidase